VRYCHELGQSWSAKYGMVRSFKVHNDEVDIIDAEMVGGAKLHWQCDLAQGLRGLPREHALERWVVRIEVFRLDA
jgi:hypothetical protein